MPQLIKYRFVNNNRSILYIGDFLKYQRSPVFGEYKDSKQFLDEVDENNISNYQRILNANIDADKIKSIKDLYNKKKFDDIPIPYGIEFVASKNKINISNYAFQGLKLVQQSESVFKAQKLVELEKHREYTKTSNIFNGQQYGKLVRQLANATVWIWSRALNKPTKLFDLSPFISTLNIGVTKNGGNFSLRLPLISYSRVQNNNVSDPDFSNYEWVIDENSVSFFNSNETLSRASLYKTLKEGELVRNKFLFHDLIQTNDIVFIRFETLELEKSERTKQLDSLLIDSSELPNKVFDLIGLVSDNSFVLDASGNRASIEISGLDLIKLFIEDGTYFFPFEVSGGQEYFGSNGKENELTKRVYTGAGSLTSFDMNRGEISIVEVFQFVLQQLSNITICPEELLQSYPASGIDKLSFLLDNSKNPNTSLQQSQDYKTKVLDKGIFKLLNIVTDEFVDKRVVVDSSLSTATGSILNFLQSVIQEEFFELLFDTYGDQYFITIRKCPFDRKSYEAVLNNSVKTRKDVDKKQMSIQYDQGVIIDISDSDVKAESLDWNNEAYSWYHLSPRANILGSSFNLNFLPAVFLDDYGKIFGSKPLMTQHNYLNFPTKETADSFKTISNLESQGMLDLKFLIETTCYLPFTRKGVITINGDRRIKRGNFIRYLSTGEIFYVDAVANNYQVSNNNISRTTTINVSRGMVEEFILHEKYSYFNILNLSKDVKYVEKKQPIYKDVEIIANQTELDAFIKTQADIPLTTTNTFDKFIDLNPFENNRFLNQLLRIDQSMFLSPTGVEFIKQHEKFVSSAYWDGKENGVDKYSIGYGYQIDLASEKYLLSKTINPQEATVLLNKKVDKFVVQVRQKMLQFNLQLNQNQFDACVSFTYSTGTLWNHMCQKIKQFLEGKVSESDFVFHWTNSSIGQIGGADHLDALVTRRQDEAQLFLGKDITSLLQKQPKADVQKQQTIVGYETVLVPDRDDFFKNFVINQEVFNFFLTRRQK